MKLVYENKLSCENDVKDFVLEGSAEIYFETRTSLQMCR